MNKVNAFINRAFDEKVDSSGLSIFRIVYFFILLCFIIYISEKTENIYIISYPFYYLFSSILTLWFISVYFLILGLFTRFFSILNFIFTLLFFSALMFLEIQIGFIFITFHFVLIFIPLSKTISLDRLLLKLKYSNTTFQYNPPVKVSQFYYYVLPFLVGVMYLFFLINVELIYFRYVAIFISVVMLLIPNSFWENLFSKKITKNPKLLVYYDAECPLCVRTKIVVSHFDIAQKIEFKTVQLDARENKNLDSISIDDLLDNIHSVDKKGKVYAGIDTYIQILSSIWYTKLLSFLFRIPGIYNLSKGIYSYIAKNRNTERCTEENCGYNPPTIINLDEVKLLKNLTFLDLKIFLWKVFLIVNVVVNLCLVIKLK
ncbi:MAG: DUF393 domain-containing protein [Flavobacteriales bacterium]|nr:DUF393 domain-containing protein [Flavobacteriales bacterium]